MLKIESYAWKSGFQANSQGQSTENIMHRCSFKNENMEYEMLVFLFWSSIIQVLPIFPFISMESSCSSYNSQSQCPRLLEPFLNCAMGYVLFLLSLWNSAKKIVFIFSMISLFTCSPFLIKYRLVKDRMYTLLIISIAKMIPGIY